MTRQKESKNQIPKFRSREEEAAFWDTHSPLDYPEQWVEAPEAKVERPLNHILAVRLDAKTIEKLAAIGRRSGIGPSTLARMWILEHLSELEEEAKEKASKHEPIQAETSSHHHSV